MHVLPISTQCHMKKVKLCINKALNAIFTVIAVTCQGLMCTHYIELEEGPPL